LLGDGAVGKTAIRENFLGFNFRANYLMTVGADFALQEIPVGDIVYKMQIWDLSGQTGFQDVRKMYYEGSHGFIVVFDLTRISTLKNIINWVSEAFSNLSYSPIPIAILGNKADLYNLSSDEHISQEMIEKTIQQIQEELIEGQFELPYFNTSAKTDQNIQKAFYSLAHLIDHHQKSKLTT
jgi:small GTP-binding protein